MAKSRWFHSDQDSFDCKPRKQGTFAQNHLSESQWALFTHSLLKSEPPQNMSSLHEMRKGCTWLKNNIIPLCSPNPTSTNSSIQFSTQFRKHFPMQSFPKTCWYQKCAWPQRSVNTSGDGQPQGRGEQMVRSLQLGLYMGSGFSPPYFLS